MLRLHDGIARGTLAMISALKIWTHKRDSFHVSVHFHVMINKSADSDSVSPAPVYSSASSV